METTRSSLSSLHRDVYKKMGKRFKRTVRNFFFLLFDRNVKFLVRGSSKRRTKSSLESISIKSELNRIFMMNGGALTGTSKQANDTTISKRNSYRCLLLLLLLFCSLTCAVCSCTHTRFKRSTEYFDDVWNIHIRAASLSRFIKSISADACCCFHSVRACSRTA